MRRSSMRRGSAVLLTILPLLSPAYSLPTYFGNDAAVAHANVERAVLPEPAVNLDATETVKAKRAADDAIADWESEALPESLPKSKRQFGGTSTTGLSSGSVSLDVGNTNANGPGTGNQPNTISNLGSEGPSAWLRPLGKGELVKREAEAEAEPVVTLDLDYVPPPLDTGSLSLGRPRTYKRRNLSL